MPNYLTKLVGELVDAGLALPVPIARFLEKDAVPFALDTRQRLPEWCQAHGYSDKQRQTLNQLIRIVVRRDAYLRAVIRGGHRIDLDGVPEAEPVSDADREAARAALAAAQLRAKQKSKPAPKPEPAPAPPGRRTRRAGGNRAAGAADCRQADPAGAQIRARDNTAAPDGSCRADATLDAAAGRKGLAADVAFLAPRIRGP